MTVLVADDHEINRRLLDAILSTGGYKVQRASDGAEALAVLKNAKEPLVALLDWEMPEIAGIDVCREARKEANADLLFLIIVTVRDHPHDIVSGLEAGANDYITKPFENAELLARVKIGKQAVEMRQVLARRVAELEGAMAQIKQLKGLLPICSYCKKIRNDADYWQEVESYIAAHTDTKFNHGICPACLEKHFGEYEVTQEKRKQIIPGLDGPTV